MVLGLPGQGDQIWELFDEVSKKQNQTFSQIFFAHSCGFILLFSLPLGVDGGSHLLPGLPFLFWVLLIIIFVKWTRCPSYLLSFMLIFFSFLCLANCLTCVKPAYMLSHGFQVQLHKSLLAPLVHIIAHILILYMLTHRVWPCHNAFIKS